MRITWWNWSADNHSTVPTSGAVHDDEPTPAKADVYIKQLGEDQSRPVKVEYDEDNNPIYIIGGNDGEALDVIYVELFNIQPVQMVPKG